MDLDIQPFIRLIQSCNTLGSVRQGKQLHLLFLKKGLLNSVLTIGNSLVQMYCRCGHTNDAAQLYEDMPKKNCFTWNTMIEGYMKRGQMLEALRFFDLMPYKNDFSWNVVISGFAKAGDLGTAMCVFDCMPWKNGTAWNAVIHGYAKIGNPEKALRLFKIMNSNAVDKTYNDSFVLTTALGASCDCGAIDCGRQIHARIIIDGVECDSTLTTSLVNLYGKNGDLYSAEMVLSTMDEPDDFSLSALISGYSNCGKLVDAKRVFSRKINPCIVSWNSLIAAYVYNNREAEAFLLFIEMQRTRVSGDSSTVASILSACSCSSLGYGKQMHSLVLKSGFLSDVVVGSALVDMYYKRGSSEDACKVFSELKIYDTILLNSMITIYSNCGKIEYAKQIFNTMSNKSLVSWNSMIVALMQNGYPVEALHIFWEMNKLGLRMDNFTLATAISACASTSSLELGEQIFGRSLIVGLECNPILSTSLVDFYCKCGFVEKGRKIFDGMFIPDEVSWNTMLMGYATNGHGSEALSLFDEMRNAGVRPSDITFIAVLSACDHCGLVDEGRKWFHEMELEYRLNPRIEHYSCMVDLFARAGCLDEAMSLIENMPFLADATMWSSVLRGCVAHGNKILGKKVAERMIELDPQKSGTYIQLSRILADSGDWERSELVRNVMSETQIQKYTGCSWVDS